MKVRKGICFCMVFVLLLTVVYPLSSFVFADKSNFESNLLNFPECYREPLKKLHKEYPNWQFIPEKTNMTFKDAVNYQYRPGKGLWPRKLVELTYEGEKWRDERAKTVSGTNTSWILVEGGRWTYASRFAIEYFMNPLNFFNENDIFMFMQQSYDSKNQTITELRSVVKNTFLENGYVISGKQNRDAYLNDIMEAAKLSGVSPFVIASMIIVEQGVKGDAGQISGSFKYKDSSGKIIDYSGYYNFFNYSASGTSKEELSATALDFAKQKNWNSRKSAIVNGAIMYKNGYIDQGQDTYYYMDYNVILKEWGHQYATSVYDAKNKSLRLGAGCRTNSNAVIQFKIPVYSDLTENYSVSSDVSSNTKTGSSSSVSSNPSSEINVKRGDINNDNTIDIIDAAMLRKHLLNIKLLDIKTNPAADANNDGVIDVIDAAMLRKHILKIKFIGG